MSITQKVSLLLQRTFTLLSLAYCQELLYSNLVLVGPYNRIMTFEQQPTLKTLIDQIPDYFTEVQVQNPVAQVWNERYNDFVQVDDQGQLLKNLSKIQIREEDKIEDPFATVERDLRAFLLQDYDREIFPWAEEGPANVSINVNFHRVLDVDLSQGLMTLLVWVRLRWIDPRLIWNATDWEDIETMWFEDNEFGSGELWTPKIELWNSFEPLGVHLYPQQFVVSDDGSIFWSRNGRIMVACNIEGLDNFPYDSTECVMEFGSWVYDQKQVALGLLKGGYEVGGSVTSSQSDHQQYEFTNITVKKYSYPAFEGYLEVDGWPVVLYRIVVHRQFMLYTLKIALPQGFLTVVGFGTFWLSPTCGERMALAITIPVANAVYDLLVFEQLPDSNVMVFASLFGLGNFIFSMMVVIETVIVIMLWEKQDPYLGKLWPSIRKATIDFWDQRDWVTVITAVDEYLSKLVQYTEHAVADDQDQQQSKKTRRFQQWKTKLVKSLQRQLSLGGSSNSSSENSQHQNGQDQEQIQAQQNVLKQRADDQDSNSRNKPILSIADIQDKEDVRQFFRDLVQYQTMKGNTKFKASLAKLTKRYGEISVQQRIVSLLAVDDDDDDFMGVHLKDYRQGAAQEYNQKWRMLSMMIDRAAQVIYLVAYVAFVVVLFMSIALSQKKDQDNADTWFEKLTES
eukprot:TRINITY_DN2756_c0_g3_i1.p1 TRINITY_DN2756_c0_g3~~TRINITY_DN2756_c0_g3_i1.p1  ORF type:complete len:680 (+),score=63.39 TRINITY_DN2756_c0_g3_i1:76-2115(+)